MGYVVQTTKMPFCENRLLTRMFAFTVLLSKCNLVNRIHVLNIQSLFSYKQILIIWASSGSL
uniref:Uncharacterized protein n=2 Tax=Anguilla anguilla TaxID=7936 RepID=A0A0E9T1L7_ANGAN